MPARLGDSCIPVCVHVYVPEFIRACMRLHRPCAFRQPGSSTLMRVHAFKHTCRWVFSRGFWVVAFRHARLHSPSFYTAALACLSVHACLRACMHAPGKHWLQAAGLPADSLLTPSSTRAWIHAGCTHVQALGRAHTGLHSLRVPACMHTCIRTRRRTHRCPVPTRRHHMHACSMKLSYDSCCACTRMPSVVHSCMHA